MNSASDDVSLDESAAVTAAPAAEEAPAAPEREVLGWLEFGDASRSLARDIVESGFEPDFVIAIARGGLIPGGALAYALGVKSCGSLNVEFYSDVEETLPEPIILPPLLDNEPLIGKNVLLVDDVADSGRTLALVVELLEKVDITVKSATLYIKPRSVIAPDFHWKTTDRWIVFPWSAHPPVGDERSLEA
ncbi:phosphoribosyltransferase [Herbiconiux sp. VKM Ac-2851]|uniref:phosphoribosyltransferase n=1 Tax=Herbiconiux sp. VKM Ac-2851 TaxID=2739025 RepID=UPI0015630391|nr:phosphoribosyltransferase [Herbiconiux sp. VKM Ac-2851]NQX33995.1 phosphoribosyltransferase [Herbiconiux sp. VKM Ac-2851]